MKLFRLNRSSFLLRRCLLGGLALAGAVCGWGSGSAPAEGSVQPEIRAVALGPMVRLQPVLPSPVLWTSSDPAVVTVVSGWVFGKGAGVAQVTARAADGGALVYPVRIEPGVALVPAPTEPVPIRGFITREGNRLLADGQPFRFLSWNVPNLHVVEDPSWRQVPVNPGKHTPVFWHRVTAFEQEDAVQAVVQMGGQVIRAYTLSIQGGRNNRTGPSHYTGPGVPLDEELMQDYDRMIAICGRHGVRLILPIIDEWDWFGGRKEFTALNGGGDFYTTRRVIDAYKAVVAQLLHRVNTVTGVAYRDDPTILAWETGNELQKVPRAWTAELAAWIKEQAPRQLVADGANGNYESIDDPHVDLVTNHYYDHGGKDYIARVMADVQRVAGRRPFFVGEFGCTEPDMELGTMDAVLHEGITGALFWSLRSRSADGGFYWHNEGGRNSAYHWPGFASNARSDERRVLTGMREKAWAIRGFLPPPLPAPAAPRLLPGSTPAALTWQGSVGAETYELARSVDGGEWTTVATTLSDADEPYRPYADTGAPARGVIRYRLKAVNPAGESPWSEEVSVTVP